MLQAGVDPYYKLKWYLNAIKHCPEHLTEFECKCRHCGSKQTNYLRTKDLAHCQDCGQSLADRAIGREFDKKQSWEENGFDLQLLFRDMAEIKYAAFPKDGVLKSMEDVFDLYWNLDKEHDFYKLFGRDEFIALLHKQRPISLIKARRIAFTLGISLYTLLSGNARNATLLIDPKVFCLIPEGYASKRPKRRYDHCSKLKLVLEYINNNGSPPLKRVCEETGITTGYLRYRYPALAQKITEKYLEKASREKLRKVYYAQIMALKYFFDQKYSDHPKSKHQAYKEVKRKTG